MRVGTDVEGFESGGITIGMAAGGRGVPNWRCQGICIGDANAIEVGCKAVVVFHLQSELRDRGRIGYIERDAKIKAGVFAV